MGLESYKNGIEGEEIAREYLVQQGYQILDQNYHSSQGEIDVVAKDKDCLVFVEVKNYSYRSYGSPVGAVGRTKKKSIIHAAEDYLYKNNIKNTYSRFDVVTIYRQYSGQRLIEHYKDAFYVN
ncbi:YraN family protein [Candidatus Margulisiibacteriota bacterium]